VVLIVRARARANPVLRSVLIVLAVLIVLWLAWLSGSMRLGALASVDRWRQVTVSPFEGPLEAGGGGSSDPPAGLEGGFRRRPHSVRAGSARIDRVGLARRGAAARCRRRRCCGHTAARRVLRGRRRRRQGGGRAARVRLSQGFARSCRPPQRDVGRPLALLCGGGGPRHSHTAAPVALRRRGARRRVAGVRTGWQAVAGPS
jgi:hypothetical protein